MANTFFKFKQFTVWQESAAMKVSTEACILGVWTDGTGAKTILDIGAGTGLLTLMLAQRYPEAQFDAVELDEAAARQATLNASESPFADRIRVIHQAIQEFSNPQLYDLIISNPPFYQNSLRSPKVARNHALHATALTFDALLGSVRKLLAPTGTFVVLLPPYEMNQLVSKAEGYGLLLQRQLHVSQRPDGRPFRQISVLGYEAKSVEAEALIIYDANGFYSTEFVRLLDEYYLNF
ncbi:MAG: methyltransferase [Cytophagaceae bacterium]|nr:methyltransferase [Cytophagaceae bacterium]